MRSKLRAGLLSSLAAGTLAIVSAGAARADDTAAEIRLLKAQLRKLEQKVAAQEQQQRRTNVAVAHVAATGGPGGPIVKGPLPVVALCPGGLISFKGICLA